MQQNISAFPMGNRAAQTIPFLNRITGFNWFLLFLICLLAGVGLLALYSAAGGSMEPYASRQGLRFGLGMFGLVIAAMIDIRWWYWGAYPFYGLCLILLIYVEFFGSVGMGAQRWIDLHFIRLQPSEVMKIGVVIVLARYFHGLRAVEVKQFYHYIIPAILIGLPFLLIARQPDLGTSLMVAAVGFSVIFVAGLPYWMLGIMTILVLATIPIGWVFFLHDYQKLRIITFLNPESDPLGAGYHVVQSKIALGSGGVSGKGFLEGTQSHLDFLPEKQTDFIFTLMGEEWGFQGGLFLLGLYGIIIFTMILIGLRAHTAFARILAFGLAMNLFLYVFINMGMVMGLLPVVGVPLPMISYGGTVMLTSLFSFGLMQSIWINRDIEIKH